jgi:hypothetical protein
MPVCRATFRATTPGRTLGRRVMQKGINVAGWVVMFKVPHIHNRNQIIDQPLVWLIAEHQQKTRNRGVVVVEGGGEGDV